MYWTMYPISSPCPSNITVVFAPTSSTAWRLPWTSMVGAIPVFSRMRRPRRSAPAASEPVGVGVSINFFRNDFCSSVIIFPLPFA